MGTELNKSHPSERETLYLDPSQSPAFVFLACALVPTGEGVADRLPDSEAGGGSEGAQVFRVLYQGKEEQ